MEFRLKPAPFVKGKRSTKGMMLEFFLVLCVVWAYAIVFNFLAVGPANGLSAVLMPIIAMATSVVLDIIVGLCKKLSFKELLDYVVHSYSYVTGLILALTIPANTSYFAVIVASLFATGIGKLVFGGFGHNIVNPAGIGRIFITSFVLGTTTASVIDGSAGATVTSKINWLTGAIPAQFNLKDLFFGNYMGALGETCTVLLLVCAAYLIVRNIIDWRLTASYLFTVLLVSFILGYILKVDFKLTYALTHLLVGGLMFGAIFMATDPVTTPSSPTGKLIYGIGCGMLTVLFRVCGSMPEGVVFSIVLMNLFTPLIDTAVKGDSKTKVWKKWLAVAIGLVIAVLVNVGFTVLKIKG